MDSNRGGVLGNGVEYWVVYTDPTLSDRVMWRMDSIAGDIVIGDNIAITRDVDGRQLQDTYTVVGRTWDVDQIDGMVNGGKVTKVRLHVSMLWAQSPH